MSHATGIEYLNREALPHTWCPGCGIGVMMGAMVRAFEELAYKNTDTVVVTGIGCTGKVDDFLSTNGLHTTHGRALAYATGIKAFKPNLHVVVLMGDGDSVTIGGNHFIHAARRNIDLTAIVVNNFNYGMTGGQVSGTTPGGSYTSTTVWGNPERDFDICALAETAGANYVARETPLNGWDLKERIKEALEKKGFSLVEVFSPCPTHFGKNNKVKQGPAMLHWLKEKCIPVEAYRRLATPGKGCFPIGKLVDRNDPDFNTRYEALRVLATAKKG
ncbi:MAG: thiamine pyrophosphate-dependent enzyme [Deltaproteobacteria bacterium]|nr:thiamine pyrophosphate-dependent enzyme [Deltaproteobacteria bacterium]